MWQSIWLDIKDNYHSAWGFAFVCPILFLIPVLVEFIQHIVEIQIGMYGGGDAAQVAADDPRRLYAGFAKTLALSLPGYWFARYVIFGRDAAAARRIAWPAIGLWGVIFAFQALQQYWLLFGEGFGPILGLAENEAAIAMGVAAVVATVIGIYFTAWFVAWPLGNAAIGPVKSFAIMAGNFWRTLAYFQAGVIPLMIVHYGLGYGAMGQPEWLVWPMMVMDSIIVGFLALLPVGAGAIAARNAAARSGVALLPEHGPA